MNLFHRRTTAAQRVADLMGRRPNLKVKRPVDRQRYRRYGWSNEGYQAWLDQEKVRIGRLPHDTAGQSKRVTTELRYVPLGRWCRQVDGHGKCFGPRLQREADLPPLVGGGEEPFYGPSESSALARHMELPWVLSANASIKPGTPMFEQRQTVAAVLRAWADALDGGAPC